MTEIDVGNLIPASQLLVESPGTRALVAGLAGEPTYLIVTEDSTLDSIGIVDNCTHLGCTFPWNPLDQQLESKGIQPLITAETDLDVAVMAYLSGTLAVMTPEEHH